MLQPTHMCSPCGRRVWPTLDGKCPNCKRLAVPVVPKESRVEGRTSGAHREDIDGNDGDDPTDAVIIGGDDPPDAVVVEIAPSTELKKLVDGGAQMVVWLSGLAQLVFAILAILSVLVPATTMGLDGASSVVMIALSLSGVAFAYLWVRLSLAALALGFARHEAHCRAEKQMTKILRSLARRK